jgi:hypothetical protein
MADMLGADPHQFSLLRELGIPTFFVVLGAGLSFLATEYLEKLKARREEQKARRDKISFLRAIGMELDALSDQLDATFQEVKGSIERVNSGTGPHIAGALRTSVFSSQLGKVRDEDDPLMVKVIHFYSDLGTLQQVIESVNGLSSEFRNAEITQGPRLGAQSRLLSGLRVLQEQISAFGSRLRELRAKLPPVA